MADWKLYFANFQDALVQLTEADELGKQRALSPLENLGLVHVFVFTFELAWKTLRKYLAFQGVIEVADSRDTARTAFKCELVTDGEGWMMMLADRDRGSRTYNHTITDDIVEQIRGRYVDLFRALSATLKVHLNDD
jgi:nucleotidyltransferase substrate binding protein (TIGR01987 family)